MILGKVQAAWDILEVIHNKGILLLHEKNENYEVF